MEPLEVVVAEAVSAVSGGCPALPAGRRRCRVCRRKHPSPEAGLTAARAVFAGSVVWRQASLEDRVEATEFLNRRALGARQQWLREVWIDAFHAAGISAVYVGTENPNDTVEHFAVGQPGQEPRVIVVDVVRPPHGVIAAVAAWLATPRIEHFGITPDAVNVDMLAAEWA